MSGIVERLRHSAATQDMVVPYEQNQLLIRRIPADIVLEAADEIERLDGLIDRLEVYGTPEHPLGVTFGITGFHGRYETARAAIDAARQSISPLLNGAPGK